MNTLITGSRDRFSHEWGHLPEPAGIAVVGAGRIGMRHIEALLLLDRPLTLEIVDTSPEALQKAEHIIREAGSRRPYPVRGRYHPGLQGLPSRLDLAVVAVTADVRYAVLEELLGRVELPYIVLEKVLFQKLHDYDRARMLLERSGVKAWVNCPLRAMTFFKQLRRQTEGLPLDYGLTASRLGLGCNSIHHLDLFTFLGGRDVLSFDTQLLDPDIMEAKRPGFVEFTGTLIAKSGIGGVMRVTSYRRGEAPPLLTIQCESVRLVYRMNEQGAVNAVIGLGAGNTQQIHILSALQAAFLYIIWHTPACCYSMHKS